MVQNGKQHVIRICAIILFSIATIITLLIFAYSFLYLLIGINSDTPFFVFNKGMMYLLGCGLTSGFLTFFMVHEHLGKKITPRINALATKMGMAFLATIFIFPQIVDFAVRHQVKSMNYIYCTDASYRWMHYQKMVFAKNKENCGNGKN